MINEALDNGVSSELSSRPAFQSSIKSVKWSVIDVQGVAETSQSTCSAQFFPLYSNLVVQGLVWPSLKT